MYTPVSSAKQLQFQMISTADSKHFSTKTKHIQPTLSWRPFQASSSSETPNTPRTIKKRASTWQTRHLHPAAQFQTEWWGWRWHHEAVGQGRMSARRVQWRHGRCTARPAHNTEQHWVSPTHRTRILNIWQGVKVQHTCVGHTHTHTQ